MPRVSRFNCTEKLACIRAEMIAGKASKQRSISRLPTSHLLESDPVRNAGIARILLHFFNLHLDQRDGDLSLLSGCDWLIQRLRNHSRIYTTFVSNRSFINLRSKGADWKSLTIWRPKFTPHSNFSSKWI